MDELLAASDVVPNARERCLRVLLLLDCMLRVIGEPDLSSPIAFASPRFKSLQSLFYGALGSERFINVSTATRIDWAHTFCTLVKQLSDRTPVTLSDHLQTYKAAIPEELVKAFERVQLNSEEVKRLRPFLLTAKSGLEYNVLLGDMLPVLGEEFTASFHEGLRAIARPKAKDTALRDFGTTFSRFVQHQASLGQSLTADLLRDPSFVQTWLVDFMEHHFMKMVRRQSPVQEGTLASLQKLWSRYRIYWTALANKGVLAAPASAFPAGNPKLLADNAVGHRKMVYASDGTSTIVTQKLIVPVPLHVTDEEATQLLFKQLQTDFNTVQSWLREHLDRFFADHDRGVALADAVESLPPLPELERVVRLERKESASIVFAVKYFKSEHGGYIDTSKFVTPIYPNLSARDGPPKERVSRYLGLPSRREAMALMAFLASQDGRFSESSLSAAPLLDVNGKRINAVETDAGLTLTVLKERDAGDGWHDVILKGEAAGYVRRWIQLTEPLRTHMRQHRIKGWRNLFVYVGNPLGAPGHFNRASNLHSAFRQFASANEQHLGTLAGQVTIPRIRSTRGVLVFLETMDLSRMARELGNNSETSLRHYLPDSLWDYFATRWLRIFQNLLIVEATKGAPYMQRALHFRSAAEMDEFLQNHALTPLIPEDETQSETATSERSVSEVMVAASPGLFATLLSISAAAGKAEEAGRELAPQALYWTEFTKRLKAYIESDVFHDRSIKRMMATASTNLDPANFEEVVCA
ncbi:hypothetical protein [Herbaspirillum camelliae]|uniref:hypothetical protein n=1 Tax=Herbaspirillum camelliae TaxID=1892903 RepID=UPI0011799D5A|nr:hypothetical protein [Herbaspirillum camelliae]